MHPQITFELRLIVKAGTAKERAQAKSLLVQWLLDIGCDAFVEGALDCDVDHDYDNESRDIYKELDGDVAPVSLYRYNREELDDIASRIAAHFGDSIACEMFSHSTQEWMEGWKESFLPFETRKFHVRPPWTPEPTTTHMDLVIEPGMAFGTGQHATTKLCLQQIEGFAVTPEQAREKSVLDVGTGTGILAIACDKLGYGAIYATDIEADAVSATLENAKLNQSQIAVSKGSVSEGSFDLVIANILSVVLRKIMPDLVRAVKPGGRLVLSGVLNEEETEMSELVESNGLTLKVCEQLEGWSVVVAKRD